MLPTEKTPPKTSLHELTALIYGPSKIGKSTWCAQAENALFLATEAGLNNLDVYQVPISNWNGMLEACREVAAGQHPFRTIVLDTVDNAYQMCMQYVCARHKVEHPADLGENNKGYTMINNELFRVLTKLSLLPYGLFLISHSQEKDYRTRFGKVTRIAPSLPNKPCQMLLGMADLILYCDVEEATGADGQRTSRRVMRTKPSAYYEAGDRTGRLPEVIDLDYARFVEVFTGSLSGSDGKGWGTPAQAGAVPPLGAGMRARSGGRLLSATSRNGG